MLLKKHQLVLLAPRKIRSQREFVRRQLTVHDPLLTCTLIGRVLRQASVEDASCSARVWAVS
jgi:hypothetical protein